jgi:hypothetical protein
MAFHNVMQAIKPDPQAVVRVLPFSAGGGRHRRRPAANDEIVPDMFGQR